MREFFHGWRRKAGCVALVMACVLTTGWIRSQREFDCFALTDNSWVHIIVQSAGGRLTLFFNSLNSAPAVYWWHGELSRDAEPIDPMEDCVGCDIEWRRDWTGFTAVSYSVKDGAEIIRTLSFIFPYWSVVLPLTLLSAYLILWKTRKKPKPAAGSVTNA